MLKNIFLKKILMDIGRETRGLHDMQRGVHRACVCERECVVVQATMSFSIKRYGFAKIVRHQVGKIMRAEVGTMNL